MIFYVKDTYAKPEEAQFPCVVLVTDNWDDNFRFETLFYFNFYDENGLHKHIGRVKIYKENCAVTRNVIKKKFRRLGEQYCSLGQDMDFYKNIKDLGSQVSKELLLAINDVVINKEVCEKFRYDDGFINSLLRFSEAEKAFNEAKQYFGEPKQKKKRIFLLISLLGLNMQI